MNLSVGPIAGVGRLRKIALIGAANTFADAPWQDDSWETWAHSSVYKWCRQIGAEPTRYFDLHHLYDRDVARLQTYCQWLHTQPTPIFMQQRYPEVPSAVEYPKERILAEFRAYMTNQVAWMVALALSEGVTHLGFWGITYDNDNERAAQRGSAEYWMGFAEGRGVHVVLPERCTLLKRPALLYGYESHPGGALAPEYHAKGTTNVRVFAEKTCRGLRQSRGGKRGRARDDRGRV